MSNEVIDYLEIAAKFIPSIGIIVGAGVALSTFLFIALKNARKEVLIEQMNIYSEFWSDKHAETRKRIAIDVEYKKLADVLSRRDSIGSMSGLSPDEYEVLEALDQFLAVFVRIESLQASSRKNRGLGKHLDQFRGYWRDCVKTRTELANYIDSSWPALAKFDGWSFK